MLRKFRSTSKLIWIILVFSLYLIILQLSSNRSSKRNKSFEQINAFSNIFRSIEDKVLRNEDKLLKIQNYLSIKTIAIDQNVLLKNITKKQFERLVKQYGLQARNNNQILITLATLDKLDDKIHEFSSLFSNSITIYGNTPNEKHRVVTHFIFPYEDKTIVQIVVMHSVKQYLWVGQIDSHLIKDKIPELFYGIHEQIFDPFTSDNFDNYHFLSQLSTSRFMPCRRESYDYLKMANQTIPSENFISGYAQAIKNMKEFMKILDWQFWTVCGTLLGWYRECSIIPYTTDADFATWSFNAAENAINGTNEEWINSFLQNRTIKMWFRWGHSDLNTEYTFYDESNKRKMDMFVIYKNGTHFIMPFHAPPSYAFSWFTPYDLCSIDLLGYKLLASCQPEMTIIQEYGENWTEPVKTYHYVNAPKNTLPIREYNFSLPQKHDFYEKT